ncbi:spore germination protein [Halalkalibacter oceani]|uniref:spore germination protein n=1 Tax=Halalkalibacter oceani TaxID=1653776 RepID=UPI00339471EE
MFNKVYKRLRAAQAEANTQPANQLKLSSEISELSKTIEELFEGSDDFIVRPLLIGKKRKAALYYVEGLVDSKKVEQVSRTLMAMKEEELLELEDKETGFLALLQEQYLALEGSHTFQSFDEAIPQLLAGESLLIIDGLPSLIIIASKKAKGRSVEEPQSEVVIRGPRDGFTENIQTNIVLIRQRVRDVSFKVQTTSLGLRSKRKVAILYLKDLVTQNVIDEVTYRIASIETDDIAETGVLEQFIEDNVLSPFPQISHTERPDKTAAHLLNGQVVILVDGTPFSLVAPITFHQLFKSPEDYYDRWLIGSLIRFLRYVAAFFTVFLPSIYIAIVSFHQGMVPTTLALSIAGSREGVPFPIFAEAMLMEATFELLREAGNRLPRPIGQTVGIVGGIIIGDAAVRAGIVSPIMVIVVALTAISSFTFPAYNVAITFRILRFSVMIAAALFGLYGIVISYILINIHLVGLRSFGSYYLSPYAPFNSKDWLDLVIRAPVSLLKMRTKEPKTKERQTQP